MNKKPDDAAEPEAQKKKDCVEGFRGLAQGDYTAWRGLTEACSTDDVAEALGRHEGGDRSGKLGGSPTRYRVYPATDAAPRGIHVWDVDDQIVMVRIHDAKPREPVAEQLGEPEAKEISRMPGFKTQWIYASRGLTLHIDDDSGEVAWLYGYRPMTVEEFKNSWLSKVEMKRRRIR